MRVRVVHLLPFALALLFAGCSYDSLAPVRFTYVVKYSVESTDLLTPTTPTVTYSDEAGADVPAGAVALPWSVELPALTYDYSSPYYPKLEATAIGLAGGESVTVTISWKDYRTGFADEALARQVVADTGGTPLDVTLYARELPLAR